MIGSRAGRVKDAYGAGCAGRAPARSWTRPPARRTRQLSGAGSRLRHTPNRANHGPKPSSNERLRSPADTGKAGRRGYQVLLVADLAAAHDRVVAAGATFTAEHVSPRPGPGGQPVPWRVYRDPAGHPFCLVIRWPAPGCGALATGAGRSAGWVVPRLVLNRPGGTSPTLT